MIIENKFQIGQIVFLKTDREQFERIITGICIRMNGMSYELSFGNSTSWHFDFEISIEKNILIATTG